MKNVYCEIIDDIIYIYKPHLTSKELDKKDDYGCTALSNAIKLDNIDTACKLIEMGADVNCSDNNGLTPLHYCCQDEYCDKLVTMLIENGANIEATCKKGMTPLQDACFFNNYEMFNKLVEVGANINHIDNYGDSVLSDAFNENYTDETLTIAKDLINLGCNINTINNKGKTPVYKAFELLENNPYNSFYLFYECKDKIDINIQNKFGNTMLHTACMESNYYLIYVLITSFISMDKYLDTDILNNEGKKAIDYLDKEYLNDFIEVLKMEGNYHDVKCVQDCDVCENFEMFMSFINSNERYENEKI